MSKAASFSKSSTAFLLIGIFLFSSNSARVFARERSRPTADVVVVHPSELPPAAQIPGQAMYLRAVGFSRYLYIEQENGKRLAVFEVSRPAHARAVAEIELNSPQFEFLQAVNSKLVLVRIAGSNGSAKLGVLDLQHPKKPTLRVLGDAEFTPASLEPSGPAKQLAPGTAIRNIRQEISDEELGSCFVLSAEGLWIIRHPAIEKDFELKELQFYAD